MWNLRSRPTPCKTHTVVNSAGNINWIFCWGFFGAGAGASLRRNCSTTLIQWGTHKNRARWVAAGQGFSSQISINEQRMNKWLQFKLCHVILVPQQCVDTSLHNSSQPHIFPHRLQQSGGTIMCCSYFVPSKRGCWEEQVRQNWCCRGKQRLTVISSTSRYLLCSHRANSLLEISLKMLLEDMKRNITIVLCLCNNMKESFSSQA